jgi:hypothetical protein
MAEDTFTAYRQRMAELGLSNDEILARYMVGPDELEAALAGLTEADLDLSRAEGKWTIRQYVHHIVSGDDVTCAAIQAALGKSGCKYSFDWYDYEGWVEMVGAAKCAVEPGIDLLRANRTFVAELMRRLPNAWERHAVLYLPWRDQWEERTAGQLIFTWVCHLPWHIRHIEETRQVCGR